MLPRTHRTFPFSSHGAIHHSPMHIVRLHVAFEGRHARSRTAWQSASPHRVPPNSTPNTSVPHSATTRHLQPSAAACGKRSVDRGAVPHATPTPPPASRHVSAPPTKAVPSCRAHCVTPASASASHALFFPLPPSPPHHHPPCSSIPWMHHPQHPTATRTLFALLSSHMPTAPAAPPRSHLPITHHASPTPTRAPRWPHFPPKC